MSTQKEYEIAIRYIPFYEEKGLSLIDSGDGNKLAKLTQVEEDIVLAFNNLHSIDSAWLRLKKQYEISDSDQEAQELFYTYTNSLLSTGVLVPGNAERHIFGERGKNYPFRISLELTNKCNFQCTHCYKEAEKKNDCFIDKDLARKVLKELEGKTWSVDFTGGEALLHPDFEELVKCADFPDLSLLTNGSLIHRIPISTLRKFNSIQISLYGVSEDEYKMYAQSNGFDQVCQNIKMLIDAGINVQVAIIVRKTNYLILRNYIDILNDLGVNKVRFGLTAKIGRNTSPSSEWDLSYEECCKLDEELQKLKGKFPGIQFESLKWQKSFEPVCEMKEPHTIKCGAGKECITISEQGVVRPCNLLPAEFFGKFHWDKYINIIKSGGKVSYDDCVSACYLSYTQEGRALTSICEYAFE